LFVCPENVRLEVAPIAAMADSRRKLRREALLGVIRDLSRRRLLME
jgi:hypothetical protein